MKTKLPPKKKFNHKQFEEDLERWQKSRDKQIDFLVANGGLVSIYPKLDKIESIREFFELTYTDRWSKMKIEDKIELITNVLIDLLWGELL